MSEKIFINLKPVDFAKYILSQNVEIYLSFDQTPILNEVDANVISSIGRENSVLVRGIHDLAVKIIPNSKFAIPIKFTNRKAFTLAFWLSSTNLKPQINKITNSKSYFRLCLFDKADFAFDSSINQINFSHGSFVIFEECLDDGINVMLIMLSANNGSRVLLQTTPYRAGMFHHFWIAYDGNSKQLVVYIDGQKNDVFVKDGDMIPAELFDDNILPFNINNNAIGAGNLVRTNSCILDDLVFINAFIANEFDISNVINYGAKYIISDKYRYKDQKINLMEFDDPGTLVISAAVANGKNFYAAKNDGSIYKGEQLIWQVKIDLSTEDDAERLSKQVNKNAEDSAINYIDSALLLFKSDLRF